MRRQIGVFNGKPMYEDPSIPPGQIFLINDNYQSYALVNKKSRWHSIRRWILRFWLRLTDRNYGRPGFNSMNFRGTPLRRKDDGDGSL
jgi:hypothetical protein